VLDSELTPYKLANNDTVNNKDALLRTGLEKVAAAVLVATKAHAGDRIIDLGCGAGLVSLPLAERGARVLAVDGNQVLLSRLSRIARERPLPGLEVLLRPIDCLALPAGCADLIVTIYAMHRLRDADKQRVVAAAFHWLKPGGTFIVADMMFGRGTTRRDRDIIRTKVRVLAKRGVGGWWRIAKNGWRYLVRVQEHPMSISSWTAMLARAGFSGITASSIVNEAGLVSGKRAVPQLAEPDQAQTADRNGLPEGAAPAPPPVTTSSAR
jgi:ubiquinone/menaquinone biosynthesis C-methylase UbiE